MHAVYTATQKAKSRTVNDGIGNAAISGNNDVEDT